MVVSLPIHTIYVTGYKLWLANKSYKLAGCTVTEDFPLLGRQVWNIISYNIVGSGCTKNCVSYTVPCVTQTVGTIICVRRLKGTVEKKPLLRYFAEYLDVMALVLYTAATTIQFKNNRVVVVNIIYYTI